MRLLPSASTIATVGITFLAVILSLLGSLNAALGVLAVAFSLGIAIVVMFGAERTGAALVVLGMLTAPLSSFRPVAAVSIVTVSDVLMFLGFGLLAPSLVFRRLHLPTSWHLGMIVLLLIGSLSCLASAEPGTSLSYFLRLVVAMIMLPVVFAWWRPSPAMMRRLAGAYVIGQVISCLDALATHAGPGGRAEGLSTHPNFFALCGLLAIGLTFALAPGSSRNLRIALAFADLMFTYGIVQSGSRAALVAAILLFASLALVERSAIAGGLVIAGGLLLIALSNWLLSLGGSSSALHRLAGDATSSYSDNARSDALSVAIHQVASRPFTGVGFENTLAAQNIYAEIAAAAGVIGLAAYVTILICYVRPLFRRGRFSRYSYPVLGYILIGALTNSLWDRFVWAALSLAIVGVVTDSEARAEPTDPPTPARPVPPLSPALEGSS